MGKHVLSRWLGGTIIAVAAVTTATGTLAVPAISSVTTVTPWTTGDPVFTPPASKPTIIGVDYHPLWSSNDATVRNTMLTAYQNAGVTHVRVDVPWDKIETTAKGVYNTAEIANLDVRFNEIAAHNMKAVVMLWEAPVWSSKKSDPTYPQFGVLSGQPTNPVDYGDALAWVANRWGGVVAAVEMWNEPDDPSFWSSGVTTETLTDRAVSYANLVKGAYPRAKQQAPNTTFILAAPASLGLYNNWFTTLYSQNVAGKYDALGLHPYVQPSDTDPTTLPVTNDWGVLAVTRVADLMNQNGDGAKKIWATEFGYSTHVNTGTETNWGRGVTEAQQADYLIKHFAILGSIPQVAAGFVYTDRDYADTNIQIANYGLLHQNLTTKPGYYALKCVASGVCGPVVPAVPSAPTNVQGKLVGPTSVTLTWEPTANTNGYQVLRNNVPLATVPSTTTAFTDTTANQNTTYTYTVKAYNSAGTSPASAGVIVVLKLPQTPGTPKISVNTVARNVTASWTQNNSYGTPYTNFTVKVRRTDVRNAAWVELKHSTDPGVNTAGMYTGPGGGQNTTVVYNMTKGAKYQLAVRENTVVGASAYSNSSVTFVAP